MDYKLEYDMVIGLDIDDTITRNSEFFSFLSQAAVNAGHKVIIITFREDREVVQKALKEWNIAYDELITSTLESSFQYGVNGWKAAMCRENKIDVFFDDDLSVIKHIDASTLCLMPVLTKASASL
jgi:hypothetical protein